MKLAYSFVALGVTLTATGFARAQPLEPTPSTYLTPERPLLAEGHLTAPRDALEMSIATGYTQGFGSLKSGVGMPSVATPGVGIDFGIGYRIDPRLAVIWTGGYQELTAERSAAARGVAGAVSVQYHLAPTHRIDPWVDAGVGYRVLWETANFGPTLTHHGFDVARVRAGLDFRADEVVSIGPMIGADATVFLFQDVPNLQTSIAEPRLSTFVFAGLQGRFDVAGTSSTGARTVSQR